MAMFSRNTLRALLPFTHPESNRGHYGVRVHSDAQGVYFCATDGHVAILHFEPYPTSSSPDPIPTSLAPFVITPPTIKAIPKASTKIARAFPHVEIEPKDRVGTSYTLTDPGSGFSITFEPHPERFPNVSEVIPDPTLASYSPDPETSPKDRLAHFDPLLLARFEEFGQALGIGASYVWPRTYSDAALITFVGSTNTIGVIMPRANRSSPPTSRPEWFPAFARSFDRPTS